MRTNLVIIPVLFTFLFSCKNKPDKATPRQSKSSDTTQQYISKLKPILQGVWIKQDYIEKILSKKSPLLAADKALGITTMNIDTSAIVGDSLKAGVTYNNQQYGDVTLKFRPGKYKTSMPFGENELGYAIKNGDISLILYQCYQNKWVLTPYIKALPRLTGNNLQEGLTHIINKNLFTGKYMLTDSLGKMNSIVFKENGEVEGFGKLTKYSVENAFADKAMNNLDQITFNLFSSSEKTFAFKIGDNAINLFELEKNIKATLLVQGKLKYKLVKLGAK